MLFKYAEKTTPFTLTPESLDWHLAKGWYRMGSNIFTTHFLFFLQRPYSAVWIRVDLEDFSFSKSQRKLLRRNADLFVTKSSPRLIDPEREELFTRYAEDFDGKLSPTIADSLEDYEGDSVFNTWETSVRERVSGKLVACSYFDLGDEAAASILGIFDPKLRSFSLGYYTMLLEMQYCMDNGIRYYYPGYVVPGYHRFDYKLRLGKSDYYDLRTDDWLAYDSLAPAVEGPVESQLASLNAFVDAFNARGGRAKVMIYPLFEAGLYDIWNDEYFPYPLLVKLTKTDEEDMVVVCFDPREQCYFVLFCRHMVQTQLLFNAGYLGSFSGNKFMTDLLAVRRILTKVVSVERLVDLAVSLQEINNQSL